MYKILITSALMLVFGTSAYMSIYGLAAVFAGAGIVVVLMGCGLELGKILTVVHLHRRWNSLRMYARAFYMAVIAALVLITACEVLGYLSQSHVQGTQDLQSVRSAIDTLNREEIILQGRITTIDATLAGLPSGYVTKRIQERQAAGYDQRQARLVEIAKERSDLKKLSIEDRAYSAPIFAAASIFGIDATRAASIFILILVAVLEPLSVGLAVATSAVWQAEIKTEKLTRKLKNCPGQKKDGQKNAGPETPSTVGQKCSKPIGNTPIAVLDNFVLDKKSGKIDKKIDQNLDKNDRKTDQNSGKIDQKNDQNLDKKSGKIDQQNNTDKVFLALVKRHKLTPETVAKITGRKNIQTVKRWMSGNSQIPEKALRRLRVFLKNRPVRLVKSEINQGKTIKLI